MKWYARTEDISRMGPYKDQREASAALMMRVHAPECPAGKFPFRDKCQVFGCLSVPVKGAFVWPEE